MQSNRRPSQVFNTYPLTMAYLVLCTWVTFLVLILGAK